MRSLVFRPFQQTYLSKVGAFKTFNCPEQMCSPKASPTRSCRLDLSMYHDGRHAGYGRSMLGSHILPRRGLAGADRCRCVTISIRT
jgi:hypothetical protein